MNENPVLGVIGGTGLYKLPGLKNLESKEIDTPFGKPSSPIFLGELKGKTIAFIARHGIGHFISPSEVNYRANIYAMKALGINKVIGISACGSLRDDYSPGDLVIPDQLIDFTKNRVYSFFGEGLVAHIGTADPYCKNLSALAYQAVLSAGANVHLGGAYITIEGPRFSTKAESNLFRSWGLSVIGMTNSPEAFLAREAELCYTTIAHVTDYDVWHESEEPVSVEMILKILQDNTKTAQSALHILLDEMTPEQECECADTLSSAMVTRPDLIPEITKNKLKLLIKKYTD